MPILTSCFLSTLAVCGILSSIELVQNNKGPDRASSRVGMQLRRKAQEDFEQQQRREIEAFLQEPLDRHVNEPTEAVDVPKGKLNKAKSPHLEGRHEQTLHDGIVPEGALQRQKLTRHNLTLLNVQTQGPRCGVQDLEYDKLPQHLKDYVDKFGTTLHGPSRASRMLDELFEYWDALMDSDNSNTVSTASSASSSSASSSTDANESEDENDEGLDTAATSVNGSTNEHYQSRHPPKQTIVERVAPAGILGRPESAGPRQRVEKRVRWVVDAAEPGASSVVRVSP